MATPVYDQSKLPCITYPLKNTQNKSKRYLGGVGVIGKTRVEINVIATSDAEINALHTFWRVDCNYGLEVFFIELLLFGKKSFLLAQFSSDFTPSKDDVKWSLSIPLLLFSATSYVIDDEGNYVLSDTGAYVTTDVGGNIPAGDIINFDRSMTWL